MGYLAARPGPLWAARPLVTSKVCLVSQHTSSSIARLRSWLWGSGLALSLAVAGCSGAASSTEADWPPLAKQWFERASQSFHRADLEDAELAVENALRIDPQRPEVRVLAARVALAQLNFDRTLQHLEGLQTTEARAVRGRALWYGGRIEAAADELDALLSDPSVRDPWAVAVAKLARRGAGRQPFRMSGGLLAVSEMPQVNSTAMIVPVEINGELALALVATDVPEAVIDAGASAAQAEPSWVSLRFAERVEVKDVPALAQDLSGISRQLNAPIKMLIGVNLLRHLNATIDFTGRQFVVRTFEPPPPPQATTVNLSYVRGGGMMVRAFFGTDQNAPSASLLVETSMPFAVALDDEGWKKAGIAVSSLQPVPGGSGMKAGLLPMLRLGAFEVPEIPGVYGAPVKELEEGLQMDFDGLVGSMLLAAFRVTFIDGGRAMWLEDMPPELQQMMRGAPEPAAPAAPAQPPPAGAPGTLPPPNVAPAAPTAPAAPRPGANGPAARPGANVPAAPSAPAPAAPPSMGGGAAPGPAMPQTPGR